MINNPFNMLKPGPKKPPRVDPKYAGLNRRTIAATIDSLLLLVLTPALDWLFKLIYPDIPIDWARLQEQINAASNPDQAATHLLFAALVKSGYVARWFWNSVVQTLLFSAFTGVCWHYWAATPGKILMRMKVVDADTEGRITTRQIILRLIGYMVSSVGLLLGFFWISWDKRRQGWHDKMANTVVIIIPFKKKDFGETPSDQMQ